MVMENIGGFTLLRNENDLERFLSDCSPRFKTIPPAYPCYVRELFDADEDTYLHYLDVSTLEAMLSAAKI